MMALSLLNLPTIGPAAPAAPPGSVVPAAGAFDLLMPMADPFDPRHEPAPDGKQIGKDMPVDPIATPNPLAWLTPPVAPPVAGPVSKPLPPAVGEDTTVAPDVSGIPPTGLLSTIPATAPPPPLPQCEQPSTVAPTDRPVSQLVPSVAGESSPEIASVTQPAAPFVPGPVPAGGIQHAASVAPVDPAVSPQLPPLVDTTTASPVPISSPAAARAVPEAIGTRRASIPAATPLIARTVSRPLSVSVAEPQVASSSPVIAPPLTPGLAGAPPLTAIPARPSLEPTPSSSGKPSGATSPSETRELPKPVSGREPGVALEKPPLQAATTPPLTVSRIAPAAQVFADAIHRAARDDRGPALPDAIGLTVAGDIKTHVVAAAADAQHGALDLRQEQWPTRMIERIDALRDAANANDTSIRLIPDALGKIDVSLKRDGETVTVHFVAQQAETRQLLADAAPKLAELAEARGLKLTQGGADTAGQQQPRPQPAPPIAAAPRRADANTDEPTDIRIA